MSKHDPPSEIAEMDLETHDVLACWRKVSAGAEMKTAIRRFLEDWDFYGPKLVPGPFTGDKKSIRNRVRELRKAMEAWNNAG